MAKKRDPSKENALARAVIEELGGIAATARVFRIKPPSVSDWRENGIPDARLMYLEAVYPQVMRKARKAANGNGIDGLSATDDTQGEAGGSIDEEKK